MIFCQVESRDVFYYVTDVSLLGTELTRYIIIKYSKKTYMHNQPCLYKEFMCPSIQGMKSHLHIYM